MSEDFLVTRRDGIMTATFNRPKTRNAMTYAMYDGLAAFRAEIEPADSRACEARNETGRSGASRRLLIAARPRRQGP